MSTRKPSLQSRSVRPVAEALEDRQMLSAVVAGTDPQGDHWTLRLIGPGTLHVSDTNGNTISSANSATPALIGTITVSATDSIESRLIGTVQPAAGSNGQVFFQNLLETGGGEEPPIDATDPVGRTDPPQPKNGLLAITMPNFWLGNTSGTVPTPPATGGSALAGEIQIPDGVSTLNFGGANTDFTPAGGTALNTDGQDDHFEVNLGTPYILGSSIIVNQVITDSQPGVANPTTGTTGSPTQDAVYFGVAGRVNLFQANAILGNTTNAPTQFTAPAGSTTGTTAGGTYLISGTGSPPFLIGNGGTTGALTGQIGNVRIGGNATNFTTMVFDNSSGNGINQNAKIANFSIGGETQNILVLAPNGLRNAYFGQGMDETQINAYVIDSLSANRGAIGSNVDVSRGINSLNIGGDVVETNIQSGYDLGNYGSFISGAGAAGAAVPTIVNRLTTGTGFQLPQVIDGGHIDARIAGSVTNSVISASVEPNPNFDTTTLPGTFTQPNSKIFPFGSPDNIIYQHGVIKAKVGGTIDNSSNPLVDANQPNQAFFAKDLQIKAGPTTPPNVPEEPYAGTVYGKAQRGVRRVIINHAVVHPKGPSASKATATKSN